MKSRIAPTPSGFLHIGNILNFVITWWIVRHSKGVLQLRIDDLDSTRSREEFLEDIFQSLHWIGIDWDEGPQGIEDFKKNFSQSLFIEDYRKVLEKIPHFVCECSRSQIKKVSPDGRYPGTCLSKGLSFKSNDNSIRFEKDNNPLGQFILWRREDLPSYQLVSVWEDRKANIDLIIRGEDLLDSTGAQKVIAESLGYKFPKDIFHHPLVLGDKGEKLSKSQKATAFQEYRELPNGKEKFLKDLSQMIGLERDLEKLSDLLKISPEKNLKWYQNS